MDGLWGAAVISCVRLASAKRLKSGTTKRRPLEWCRRWCVRSVIDGHCWEQVHQARPVSAYRRLRLLPSEKCLARARSAVAGCCPWGS